MRDVTAVVLTLGEETTRRAIRSLEIQSVPPKEIIVIRDVTPFHKAINLGASKVKTEFFMQVDADMVLDENCLEELRKAMGENVGIAMGALRDPLMGIEAGIKMFRKKCFEDVQFRNSISPDTDFYRDIGKYGWKLFCVLNVSYADSSSKLWPTFGEHRPQYTEPYTYSRYYVVGKRYRYRKDWEGLQWRFQQLQKCSQQYSLVAQIGMAHGIFLEAEKDLLEPLLPNGAYAFLRKFMRMKGAYKITREDIALWLSQSRTAVWEHFCKLGIELRNRHSFDAFKKSMELLSESTDAHALLARIGLCHGLSSEVFIEDKFADDYRLLEDFLFGSGR
jgi:hypothetical protein